MWHAKRLRCCLCGAACATGLTAPRSSNPALLQGAVVASYPYDGTVDGWPTYNATKDDATFKHMALSYANYNPRMASSTVGTMPLRGSECAFWQCME